MGKVVSFMFQRFQTHITRIRPLIERHPFLCMAYRTIRDAWVMDHQKPEVTQHGFRFMGLRIMQDGSFEPEETALIKRYLPEAEVFVDVGANSGFYTCLAKSQGKYTIAIEPMVENQSYLYANLLANGWTDVEVWPVGVGYKPGLARFYGGGTGASLISGWADASPVYRCTAALSTLDILLGKRFQGKRLIIKMDVEGAEYEALRGATSVLKMTPRPLWLVEIAFSEHHPGGFNPHYQATFDLFWRAGYRAYRVGPVIREISETEMVASLLKGEGPIASGNFFFEAK
jgi:FkbM family methyltransferase